MGWEYLTVFSSLKRSQNFNGTCVMKFLKIPTSFRDIRDYIYLHLLPRDCVISYLKGINYYTFILVQCVSL